jgi:hypothetical protein
LTFQTIVGLDNHLFSSQNAYSRPEVAQTTVFIGSRATLPKICPDVPFCALVPAVLLRYDSDHRAAPTIARRGIYGMAASKHMLQPTRSRKQPSAVYFQADERARTTLSAEVMFSSSPTSNSLLKI